MTADMVDLSGLHKDVFKGMSKLWQEYYPFVELPQQLPIAKARVLLSRLETAPDRTRFFPRAKDGVLDSLRALLEGCAVT